MSKTPSGTKSPRHNHIVYPETESLVTFQATPHAVCSLRHAARQDHRLQLDADENGVVRFHAKAAKNAAPIEMMLEVGGGSGKKTVHTLELRADPTHSADAEPQMASASPRARNIRPALTGDQLKLSNTDLLARGYPPRPDPAVSPSRHARWLRQVSQPFAAVDPTRIPHPGVSFAKSHPALKLMAPTLPLPPPVAHSMFNSNSGIWSGAYLSNPNGQFYSIQADWNVPGVFGLPNGPGYSAVAEWIGLDSSGTDLYQAGTDSECFNFGEFGWVFTNYWIWIELLPFAPWGVPNFPVSPGDSISVDIFVADQSGMTWFQNQNEGNGGLTGADDSVWFMLYNYTQGASFWGTLPVAPVNLGGLQSTGFTGTTAEFIIERPTDTSSNTPYPLASFGFATMQGCWYGDALYGDRPWALAADGTTPFDGNLAYLNMQNSGDLLALPFSLPDPTSPSGFEILWLWTNYS
jgi:Peptidase A4 family